MVPSNLQNPSGRPQHLFGRKIQVTGRFVEHQEVRRCMEAESTNDTPRIGRSEARRTRSHRTFTPYFCVNGGTMPFKRRYSTSCP